MSNLKLKEEFTNKLLTRKSTATGVTISVDTSKMPVEQYQAYSDIGFMDIFESKDEKMVVNLKIKSTE